MTRFAATLLTLTAVAFALPAQAQLIVLGNGQAAMCYNDTISGDKGTFSAIHTCTEALKETISAKDQAATYVNRGVLYMRKGDQVRAEADYSKALQIQPDLTEAHINRAASLIRLKDFDGALAALDTALKDENLAKRPEALYNRAIALDWKEDYRGAYFDLKEALAIRPNWAPAQELISRYNVQPAG
jgi:tetratricopeptide (TPR) repeat protein